MSDLRVRRERRLFEAVDFALGVVFMNGSAFQAPARGTGTGSLLRVAILAALSPFGVFNNLVSSARADRGKHLKIHRFAEKPGRAIYKQPISAGGV